MSVHPEIESILEAARATGPKKDVSVAARREGYRSLAQSLWPNHRDLAEVRDIVLGTDPPLPARLYVPEAAETTGLLVYFHGGSFVLGDLESHDGLCRHLAADTRLRLMAVEYRLAPEHPFPAAIDDAIAAVRFVGAHISDFADPRARLVVLGDSAGATLAAVAASATRHDELPIAGQALMYPTMGPEMLTTSAHEYASGYLLDLAQLRRDYASYLGEFSDHTDERVSPLMSLDLTGSPPAIVVVAEFDPLRDEAVAYAGLLEHFGGTVELLEAEGMVHGFLRLGGVVPDALDIVDQLAEHVHRFVGTTV